MGNKNTYGATGRGDTLSFKPETLKVITDPKHPLYDSRVEREPTEAMILSIMRRGILVPMLITRDGEDVFVVDGRQRRAAAIEANKRLAKAGGALVTCPCVWKKAEEAVLFEIAVTTNELRTGDSPLERAKKMQHLVDIAGYSADQLAVTFGCTPATVKNTLALLECAPSVQKAVESGKLAAIHATKLSKLSREEQVSTLEKMVEAGATKGERAHKAVKKKGEVEPKHKALSPKVRERVREALASVAYTEKDETVILASAVIEFVSGNTEALKRWPHLEGVVVSALMPVKREPKPKKEKAEKKHKRSDANGAQVQASA